ncbi:MAG: substrate-binding domain-containing protein [Verrucomicrobia bacterium]|nr:substrate-binding domain-containing protein [Verrucomicrobiota bacterium]
MIRRRSAAEQTAAHLIEELGRGRWRGVLPGVNRLAEELGVSRETMRTALVLVEQQGFLRPQGEGRARAVVEEVREKTLRREGLRVAMLLRESLAHEVNGAFQRLLMGIWHGLEEAGHVCVFTPKTQEELGHNPARIIRMAKQIPADVWLVSAGSLEILQWFAAGEVPALAIGGRIKGLPIAGASRDPLPAFRAVFRDLIGMGHRRITLISGRERRLPSLSAIERTLKEEFETHGIPFGPFNVPDWEPTPDGLDARLRELFRVTPPTAIQVHSSSSSVGLLSFLHRHHIRVPEDVSIICESMENAMAWHRPALAHFSTDWDAILRRVLCWVDGVAKGREDRRQMATGAVFHPGGSIAPPGKWAWKG